MASLHSFLRYTKSCTDGRVKSYWGAKLFVSHLKTRSSRLETRSPRLETRSSRLETRSSKFSSFEDGGSSRLVRVSRDCHLTFARYCKRLKRRNLKKFRLERESNPWPLWYRCRGHGIDSRSSLNFFRFLLFNRLGWNIFTAMIYIICRSSQFAPKPEFFQVSSFQPLRLKHLHCDDLHNM